MKNLILIIALAALPAAASPLGSFLDGLESGRTGRPMPQRQEAQESTRPVGLAIGTGQRRQVQIIGGGYGYSCEYNYLGQTFWRTYRNYCPPNVDIP